MTISDPNNNDVHCEFWTNLSGSWIQVMNTTVYNGFGIISYIAENITEPNTKYWWSMNVTDLYGSGKWINKTFWFITGEGYPIISDVYPNEENALYNPVLSVKIQDTQNDHLTVIFKTNASGTWQLINEYRILKGGLI